MEVSQFEPSKVKARLLRWADPKGHPASIEGFSGVSQSSAIVARLGCFVTDRTGCIAFGLGEEVRNGMRRGKDLRYCRKSGGSGPWTTCCSTRAQTCGEEECCQQ